MTTQIKIYSRLLTTALAALACAALLLGCGGTGTASPASTPNSTSRTQTQDPAASRHAAAASRSKMACEQAVRSAPSLAPAAKDEIAALCFRINYIPEDNERTVRSVCQEVANASSLASDDARKRTLSACYAAGMK